MRMSAGTRLRPRATTGYGSAGRAFRHSLSGFPTLRRMRRWLGAVALLLAGCTPGSSAIAGGGSVAVTGRIVPVDVNLTNDPGGNTPGGAGAGYLPLTTNVNVGDG